MQTPNSHRFFANADCKYFPCHKGGDAENFNCLFCYCPLYFLGDRCGGNFAYGEEPGRVKDCTACTLPHAANSYDFIVRALKEANKK